MRLSRKGGIMAKRIFLIVLDSFGIGELPDAGDYNDTGSNTFKAIFGSKKFYAPNMKMMGLFNIDGVDFGEKEASPVGAFGRLGELSAGKDTTTGHWEIAGYISKVPLPTYPNGFPDDMIDALVRATGRKMLCNKPYSGTQVIQEYGREHMKTGNLILYTSADSVAQIAAHEEVVPLDELYDICQKARDIFTGEHGVGRIIARPFVGEYPDFKRTENRHDFSLMPPEPTMLDRIHKKGMNTIGVGKIHDIFAGRGVGEKIQIKDNKDGMKKTKKLLKRDFKGLCFVNLVDFDMLYGHRNDIDGYAAAISEFDDWLPGFIDKMEDDDLLMITADHGCDPSTPSTDHSREYVPLLMYGAGVTEGENLGTKESFSYVAQVVESQLG